MANAEPIKPIKYKFTDENVKFSPDYFYGQMEQFVKFASIKPTTSKGLSEYLKLDPNAGSYTSETLEEAHKYWVGAEQNQLQQFSRKNSGGLVGILKEEEAREMATNFRGFKKKGEKLVEEAAEKERKEKEDKYNNIVNLVNKQQELQTTFKDRASAEAYKAEMLKKVLENPAGKFLEGFYRGFADVIMKGRLKAAEIRADYAVKKYGASKYINENLSQAQKFEKPTEDMQKAQKGLADLQEQFEVETDAKKKTDLAKKLEEEGKKFQEKFEDYLLAKEMVPQMFGKLQEVAYITIAQKKAEEEKKKKDKEKKK